MSAVQKLLEEVEVFKGEYEKFERGNNAAGTRARKALQEIKNCAQDLRKAIQEAKNSTTATA